LRVQSINSPLVLSAISAVSAVKLFWTSSMSLIEKTATELLTLQAEGKASAVEIADAFLAACTAREPKLQSFMLLPNARPASRSVSSRACRSR
jgi:hypothetical protein